MKKTNPDIVHIRKVRKIREKGSKKEGCKTGRKERMEKSGQKESIMLRRRGVLKKIKNMVHTF
jgi:hypothetical protein